MIPFSIDYCIIPYKLCGHFRDEAHLIKKKLHEKNLNYLIAGSYELFIQ